MCTGWKVTGLLVTDAFRNLEPAGRLKLAEATNCHDA